MNCRDLGSHARPRELATRVEVVGRPEVVEQREILVHGLHAEGARVGRGLHGDGAPVHLDRAAVEPMNAAQALDQGRLACTVVSEERQHLTGSDLEVDAVERNDRSKTLHRVAYAERGHSRGGRIERLGIGRHAAALAAWATRSRDSIAPRRTSASTASSTTTPIAISW